MLKRLLNWTVIVTLLFSLLPVQWIGVAEAAAATYFFPDNNKLRSTANMVATTANLTRDNVYISNFNTMRVDGSFQGVEINSMTARVDQMVIKSTGWDIDGSHFNTAPVAVNPDSTSRFTIANLELFPGFNKITFSGKQGNATHEDVFYVLYEEAPYLQSIKVYSGSATPVFLNEGSKTVVTTNVVSFEGKAPNATEVTIGGFTTSPLGDGTFYISGVQLQPGLNTMTISLENPTSKTELKREIYLYDENAPFTKVDVNVGAEKASILNPNLPPVITDSATNLTLNVEMLVPVVTNVAFKDDLSADVKVNTVTQAAYSKTSSSETLIKGSDGVTNSYKIVNFTTDVQAFTGNPVTVTLDVYHNKAYQLVSSFKHFAGDININNMYLLTEDVVANSAGKYAVDANTAKVPLNGSEVNKADFYILVEGAKNIAGTNLKFRFPGSTSDVTLTAEPDWDYYENGVVNPKWEVYKISAFPTGLSKPTFFFTNINQSIYKTEITHVTKNYIYLESPLDGQVVSIDSSVIGAKTVPVIGEFIGFTGVSGAEYEFFINGKTPFKDGTTTPLFNAADGTFPLPSPAPAGNLKFSANATIGTHLFVGENRVKIVGRYNEGNFKREIVKEIKLVIFDQNTPTILKLQPGYIKRKADGTLDTPLALSNPALFTLQPEHFQTRSNNFITSLKEYSLVFQIAGASHVKLSRNGLASPLIDHDIAALNTITKLEYEGTGSNLTLRYNDIPFTTTGSHIYTLELTNANGATTRQVMELVRETAGFRVLSPVPTVDNKVVVSKNFVNVLIEAEGAEQVLVDGEPASSVVGNPDLFQSLYVGLKPNKDNAINLQISRPSQSPVNGTINVYYTSATENFAQYMETMSTKHSVFNGKVSLSFPKGTVLKSANPFDPKNIKYYEDQKLLFGLANPQTGEVAKKDDSGNNILNIDYLANNFTATSVLRHFSRVSDAYWISGGYGETTQYSKLDGVLPVFREGGPASAPIAFTNNSLIQRRLAPTERGTLTLKFDDSVVQDAGTVVTILHLNDQGTWEVLGGEVDTGKNTITIPFTKFGYYMVGKAKNSFRDVTDHPWARNILAGMFAKGLMPAFYYNDMGTEENISRGEFAKILVKAANLPLVTDSNNTFVDIPPSAASPKWDYAHIETAARAGIVTGMTNNVFSPDEPLTREQAATMIARAQELKLSPKDAKLDQALEKVYTDAQRIEFYAKPAVEAVTKAKIMEGLPNVLLEGQKPTVRFEPKAFLTRAQAAKIAVKVIQSSNSKIFPKNFD